MKNTLAENMIRFGVKNLNESEKDSLKALAEQNPAAAKNTGKPTTTPKTPHPAAAKSTGKPQNPPVSNTSRIETVNLYVDKANKIPWNTGIIVEPKIIDKIKFSNGTCTIKIQLRASGQKIWLQWDSKRPNEFTYMPYATTSAGEKIVYNQNLSDKLRSLHKKTIYNKNATYAQTSTPAPEDGQSVA